MAVSVSVYPSWKDKMGLTVNMNTDTFKVVLLDDDASFNAAHDELADVSGDEIPGSYGYTTGGATIGSTAWTSDGTDSKLDGDDVTWTASGGAITAYKAVIYDDTISGDPLVAFIDFDGVVTAVDGAQFKIIWNADGILTLS